MLSLWEKKRVRILRWEYSNLAKHKVIQNQTSKAKNETEIGNYIIFLLNLNNSIKI